jgi:hypothetical protein
MTDACIQAIRSVREESRIELDRKNSSRDAGLRYRVNYQKRSPFEWLVTAFLPLVYINGGFAEIEGEKGISRSR